MSTKTLAVAVVLSLCVATGCVKSGVDEQLVKDVPRYPNAEEKESMGQSLLGGMMSASLVQYTTADSFDDVMEFYSDALANYETEVSTYSSELGRQTAIDVTRKKGVLTIAVQEFSEEKRVNITVMVGKSP